MHDNNRPCDVCVYRVDGMCSKWICVFTEEKKPVASGDNSSDLVPDHDDINCIPGNT